MHRTLDELAAEVRPMVFRLLDAGRPRAAAELVETYTEEADAAFWFEVLAPAEVEGGSVAVDPDPVGDGPAENALPAEDALEPTAVRSADEVSDGRTGGRPAKRAPGGRGGGRGATRGGVPAPASGPRARATVTR
jgi:hypothetical protein